MTTNRKPRIVRVTEEDAKIGWRIMKARQSKNVTQTELAIGIGTKYQQIQKFEHGVDRISAGALKKISLFLEIDVNQLLHSNFGEEITPEPQISHYELDQKAIRLLKGIRSPQDKQALLALMESLNKKSSIQLPDIK